MSILLALLILLVQKKVKGRWGEHMVLLSFFFFVYILIKY